RDIAITSKYEDRWKKMQKNFYDVTMINSEHSPELSLEGNFDFSDVNLSVQGVIDLYKKTQRFDSGFINFERCYTLDDGAMLRLSMGSFDKPEHLYVIVKKNEAYYYPKTPLRSKSNLIAHKLLNEVLCG
ncbi:MAG: tRNA (guanosine(46)-N7)-methyltransferase TrmB, partial [Sulfurimonas sp.]|nr:tRNA (guanosine(46)-N7)-methyltransferase TrmB [Sulfurimonas sp.]